MSDYPGYRTNPKIKELIDRCRELSVSIHNPSTGTPYAESTLRSRCLVRKVSGAPVHRRGSRGPSMISTDTEPDIILPSVAARAAAAAAMSGASRRKAPNAHAATVAVKTEMIGNDGRRYIVALRKNGSHFWKPCDSRDAGCIAGQHGGGGGSSVLNDPTLQSYLQLNGLTSALTTLVPLGILWTAYNATTGGSMFSDFADSIISPQTMVPLALGFPRSYDGPTTK